MIPQEREHSAVRTETRNPNVVECDYVLVKIQEGRKGNDQDCFGIWCQGSHPLPLVKWQQRHSRGSGKRYNECYHP